MEFTYSLSDFRQKYERWICVVVFLISDLNVFSIKYWVLEIRKVRNLERSNKLKIWVRQI